SRKLPWEWPSRYFPHIQIGSAGFEPERDHPAGASGNFNCRRTAAGKGGKDGAGGDDNTRRAGGKRRQTRSLPLNLAATAPRRAESDIGPGRSDGLCIFVVSRAVLPQEQCSTRNRPVSDLLIRCIAEVNHVHVENRILGCQRPRNNVLFEQIIYWMVTMAKGV